ncbi:RraA family protein [Naasia aerilata]|uniref:Putative 4-hydroxy-4-methyl-2-oxoglutarate aldolase n=1 Tax=Naasia aerilata TaxID=1162966 RepID=A0ABN6XM60_9MICO|nr:RraA family protein [Naasia aerilata]BDZ45966.1 demethylmenaquinone methyltransferase [Naasia aerilata]
MALILSTAAVADASLRIGVPARPGPSTLVPLLPGAPFAGPACPVTHLGSVDVLLETIDDAAPGGVLVVDNGGREDEACLGDLMVLEAREAGFAGIVVWGRHRDTTQLVEIGLPLHSMGARSYGPRRVPPAGRAMRSAFLDGVAVSGDDWVVGDDDGVLFLAPEGREEIFALAASIQETEGAQAQRMRGGQSLRSQLDFAGYRRAQAADPSVTLRRHLQEHGGAIEV